MTAAPVRPVIETDLAFDSVLYVGFESANLVRQPGLVDHIFIRLGAVWIALELADMTMRPASMYGFWDIVCIAELPLWIALFVVACRRVALWRDVRALVRATALHRVPA